MFVTISFPWPVPSANIALTGLSGNSNPVRVADQQVDDREPVGAGYGSRL
jgi:hypothetical protein